MKVGIIGGSFDPIHYGHLIMAETLREECGLNKIIFIPTGNAPHKVYENEPEVRFEMVEIAISDNEYFQACDIEVKSSKISYTYDTLSQLKKENPECDYSFIIGLDNLYDLANWNNFGNLSKITRFLLVNRLGYYDVDYDNILDKISQLKNDYGAEIELVEAPIIEISSSMIRKRISKGESINYLTAKEIIEYIEEKGLYKQG